MLGLILYVVMSNDVVDNGLLLHKFMNDSTVTETIYNPADNVVKWTDENNTRINGTKTKEMIIIKF